MFLKFESLAFYQAEVWSFIKLQKILCWKNDVIHAFLFILHVHVLCHLFTGMSDKLHIYACIKKKLVLLFSSIFAGDSSWVWIRHKTVHCWQQHCRPAWYNIGASENLVWCLLVGINWYFAYLCDDVRLVCHNADLKQSVWGNNLKGHFILNIVLTIFFNIKPWIRCF